MRIPFYKLFLMSLFLLQSPIYAKDILNNHKPIAMVYNSGSDYTLINSVDYHPKKNLFCVTYTNTNKLVFYKIDSAKKPKIVQILSNPKAEFSGPQHAVFSPDGEKVVVANWANQTLGIYQKDKKGLFQEKPAAIFSPPSILANHKPHGIAFSPCGKYLAIAYGSAAYHPKALALFGLKKGGLDFELLHILDGDAEELPGIPKGIAFSPDGTCLLVTFCDVNSLVIFNLSENKQKILQTPRQTIQGEKTGIFRPEDVKIAANGKYCAISNSDHDTVTFYSFDKSSNLITRSTPCDILQNPDANFHIPHGIAFSPDGSFMIVTEFGKILTTEVGDIIWDETVTPDQSKFNLYDLR